MTQVSPELFDPPPLVGRGDTVLLVDELRVERSDGAPIVDGVSFELRRGRTLGLVGESGCGKSMIAKSLLGLLPEGVHLRGGDVRLMGESVLGFSRSRLGRYRGSDVGTVWQDPTRSLNPTMRIGDHIEESLRLHRNLGRAERRRRVIELLQAVKLPDAPRRSRSYPHELSGGMRQRVVIASALAADPDVLIADEPTTALDVTVQAQILDLIDELRRERDLAVLLITHDLAVASQRTDEIAVMYAGQILEHASTRELLYSPRVPYTRALLDAAPEIGVTPRSLPERLTGPPPEPGAIVGCCPFHPRCDRALPECAEAPPEPRLSPVEVGRHQYRCFNPHAIEELV